MRPVWKSIRRTLSEINDVLADAQEMRREARRRYGHLADET